MALKRGPPPADAARPAPKRHAAEPRGFAIERDCVTAADLAVLRAEADALAADSPPPTLENGCVLDFRERAAQRRTRGAHERAGVRRAPVRRARGVRRGAPRGRRAAALPHAADGRAAARARRPRRARAPRVPLQRALRRQAAAQRHRVPVAHGRGGAARHLRVRGRARDHGPVRLALARARRRRPRERLPARARRRRARGPRATTRACRSCCARRRRLCSRRGSGTRSGANTSARPRRAFYAQRAGPIRCDGRRSRAPRDPAAIRRSARMAPSRRPSHSGNKDQTPAIFPGLWRAFGAIWILPLAVFA